MRDVSKDSRCVFWFWQRIVTPHMASLARALAAQGCSVVYVAEQPMSSDRLQQGWKPAELGLARLVITSSKDKAGELIDTAPKTAIHICQGLRANGIIEHVQRLLSKRGMKQWVVMETVDDSGWQGAIKRLLYRYLIWKNRKGVDAFLTIGAQTSRWITERGAPESRVFPFAYFLEEPNAFVLGNRPKVDTEIHIYTFIYVGQLIARKRIDSLISALKELQSFNFQLIIVGVGELEQPLRDQADLQIPGRVRWLGAVPMSEVSSFMRKADCLILPSVHDGWGAVISEALMVGTPVICSDACGAQIVVRASGEGAVFESGNVDMLVETLRQKIKEGPWPASKRTRLENWAKCLGAKTGATYLTGIVDHIEEEKPRPSPPWVSHHS